MDRIPFKEEIKLDIVLTKVTTPVIGWVASILGWIINMIYEFLELIHLPNIGVAIILFTLVVYLLMLPLQIKQQKFSKMNAVMQPELQKIEKKYKDKKDNESLTRKNEELQAVYMKYGVSPTGSCVQLLIQMPVLLALYQVIYHIPGYITGVRNVFTGLADKIMAVDGFGDIISQFLTDNKISMVGVSANMDFGTNNVIDFLYKLSPSQMEAFSSLPQFSSLSSLFNEVSASATRMNTFLNLNISDNPLAIIKSGWSMGNAAGYLMIVAAVLVPVLAWLTQVLNYKLMPQAENPNKKDGQPSTMETTMKSMNTFMPLMSAFFCLTLPVGIGIYWIIGAVIRSVQMVVINKKMDSIDVDDLIRENQEKAKKKMEKRGIDPEKINQQARMNVRNIENKASMKADANGNTSSTYRANVKKGSIASKANMVKDFDDMNRNTKSTKKK